MRFLATEINLFQYVENNPTNARDFAGLHTHGEYDHRNPHPESDDGHVVFQIGVVRGSPIAVVEFRETAPSEKCLSRVAWLERVVMCVPAAKLFMTG